MSAFGPALRSRAPVMAGRSVVGAAARLARVHRAWLEAAGWVLSVIGFVSFGSYLWRSILLDGGAAFDLHSYLLAGRNLLEGAPLYVPMEIDDPGAYRYPPTFAALAVPLALAPEELVTWLYRAACFGCVRYLVGSWRAVGWALILVPVQIELIALNVTLPIAAAACLALRGGRAGAVLLPATAALKYGTGLLLPYLWLTRPDLRHALVVGCAGLAGVFALHAAIDPAIWGAYLASLGQQAASANVAPHIGEGLFVLLPSTLGDFAVRASIAVVLVTVAIRRRWDWLAYAAAAIAVPTLWMARLAALIGVPRLWLEESAAEGPARHRRLAPQGDPGARAARRAEGVRVAEAPHRP